MYDFQPTPEEQQIMLASLLRGRQALSQASQRASQFDNMAAITQMANNPGAAAAAQMAAKSAQGRYSPQQMGNQGFMLPDSGDFVESPMFVQDKMAQRGLARQQQADRLAQQQEMLQQRLLSQAQQAAAERALRAQMAGDRNALMLALAELKGSQSRDLAEFKAGLKPENKGKTLSHSAVKDITDKEGARDAFTTLAGTFKDEFSGTPIIAPYQNILGKFTDKGGYQDQANWWQNYQEQVNMIRNKLFGSALTATEKAEFEKQMIQPGNDPKTIRTRLEQQASAAQRAYAKIVKNLGAAGYDVSGLNVELGMPEPAALPGSVPAKRPAAAPGAAPRLQLPPGFKVIGEAP